MGIVLGKKKKGLPIYMYLPYFSVARYANSNTTIFFLGLNNTHSNYKIMIQ